MEKEKTDNVTPRRRPIGWAPAIGLSLVVSLVGSGILATAFSLGGIDAETSFAYAYVPIFFFCLWGIRRTLR